jgi:hypothetical protein
VVDDMIETLESRLATARDAHSAVVAERDQLSMENDAAQNARDGLRELAVQARLGEVPADEAELRRAEVIAKAQAAQAALDDQDALVAGLAERVQEAGDKLAEAIRAQAVQPLHARDQRIAELERLLAAERAMREREVAEYHTADDRAQEVLDDSRTHPASIEGLQRRRQQARATINAAVRLAQKGRGDEAQEMIRSLRGRDREEGERLVGQALAQARDIAAHWDQVAAGARPRPAA